MQFLLVDYQKILRRHGVSWTLQENKKVAVVHVLSAIRPHSIKVRLESDLEFSKTSLKKDFKGFMKHELKL